MIDSSYFTPTVNYVKLNTSKSTRICITYIQVFILFFAIIVLFLQKIRLFKRAILYYLLRNIVLLRT